MTKELFSGLEIRLIHSDESKPYELFLLADPSKELIDQYLKNSEIYVALLDNKIIGTYVLHPINANLVEIKNIAVDINFQKKGIGKLLLEHAVRIAKQQNYKTICIGTGNSSIGELYLYQKQGFEISEIKKDFFLENYPEPIFDNGIQVKHMVMLSRQL